MDASATGAGGGGGDDGEAKDAVLDFATYEDYLDAQISELGAGMLLPRALSASEG